MPLIGEYHTKFWATSDTTVPTPVVSRGGYPGWQASVIAPSLPFGPLGAWIDGLVARVCWWWHFLCLARALSFNQRAQARDFMDRLHAGRPVTPGVITKVVDRIVERPVEVVRETVREVAVDTPMSRRIAVLDQDRQRVLTRSLELLESPAYPVALEAVRETATTIGFNRPEAWLPYSRAIKADPGRAENTFRHIKAAETTKGRLESTLSNPTLNLLTELAYHGFATKAR